MEEKCRSGHGGHGRHRGAKGRGSRLGEVGRDCWAVGGSCRTDGGGVGGRIVRSLPPLSCYFLGLLDSLK